MEKVENLADWESFLKSVKPLKGRNKMAFKEVPPRLRVRRSPMGALVYEIDLHGKTVQEAYELTKRFIALHFNQGSKEVRIITGKGTLSKGLIKNEIGLWFDTGEFQEKISSFAWENDGGVLKIILKRNKNLCKKKLF